jgi:anti-sigma factor RsiW
MAVDLNNETLIARYLLGELSEEQQIEIEDRAFADPKYLANITAVENDLIDEYVRNELSGSDRKRFEKRFLASAERRKRVEFARALTGVISEQAAPNKTVVHETKSWSWRDAVSAFINGLAPQAKIAFVSAVPLLVIGAGWLFTETLRLRRELTELRAESQSQQTLQQQALERERRRSEELNAQLNQEKQQREQTDESLRELSEAGDSVNPAPRPVIASLTLLPGLSRGGGDTPNLVLPTDARLVRLQVGIDPEEQYKNFAVELVTLSGRRVWTGENLSAKNRRGARAIGLTIPATAFKDGEYELKLRGVTDSGAAEDVGFYYFNVKKR